MTARSGPLGIGLGRFSVSNFQSRPGPGGPCKALGHTIRFTIVENPMLHTNFMALRFVELKLLPIETLYCRSRLFGLFCFCDLDLMIFIHSTNLSCIPCVCTVCAKT